MLVRFAVENYNSFKEQQVFSMVASKYSRHANHCYSMNGKRLLKSSFFFGGNASGKSNFVHALDFLRRVALKGTEAIQYSDRYFRVDSESKGKPGVFQIDFMAQGKAFSYGLAIKYLTHEIEEEWLYTIDSTEKEVCIFEREHNRTIRTGLSLSKEEKTRFDIYCEDIQADRPLLTEIGNKKLDANSELYPIIIAYEWFKKIIVVYPHSHHHNRNKFFLPASNTEEMANLLRDFDTGIIEIKKGKQSIEKAFAFLPDDIRKGVIDDLEHSIKQSDQDEKSCIIEIGDQQFEISFENGELVAEKIMLDHGNASDLFEVSDESDGTRRLLDLIPLYEYGRKERIIVVDELDRSFHSKLTEEYIKRFFSYTDGKPSQLICTTHDLNIMDLKLIRQDEIWFVERGEEHYSKIYSLSDYKQRFDKNILNDYLLGRYGAIPCFREDDWQVNNE